MDSDGFLRINIILYLIMNITKGSLLGDILSLFCEASVGTSGSNN